MTKVSKKSVAKKSGLNERPAADFLFDDGAALLDRRSIEALVSSAVLVTTAFRLRDREGMNQALRLLVQAVRPFEHRALDA